VNKIILSFLFWLVMLSVAEAATYYVKSSCTNNITTYNPAADTCTGGSSRVYSTINNGLTGGVLTGGDTLDIRAGTYSTLLQSANIPANVTIHGHTGETVIIDGSSVGGGGGVIDLSFGSGKSGITFDNLIIDPNNVLDSFCFYIGTNNVTISNSILRNCGGKGGLVSAGTTGFTIQNSEITHFGYNESANSPDFIANTGYGIYGSGSNMTIDNVTIHDGTAYGLHIYESGCSNCTDNSIVKNSKIFNTGTNLAFGSSAVLVSHGNNLKVFNNLIYSNSQQGLEVSCDNCGIYNNTVTANGGFGIQINAVPGALVKNNIVYNNGSKITNNGSSSTITFNLCETSGSCGTSAVSGNPGFVSSSDFHLALSSSPAVNAGTDVAAATGCTAGATCRDYAGTVRPQGAGWDIGAYEFASATTVTVSITGFNSTSCINTLTTVGTNANGACIITGQANNTIVLSGLSTQSTGSVTWSCDRCGSGSATGTSAWTTSTITLKSGINIVTVSGIDASLNAGADTIAITYAPTFPGPSLVGAWGFEDGSGVSATDSSGNGNTGTLTNGPTWITTGRFGKALSFNGINQNVTITDANSLHLTQSFTISAWVQPAASFTTFKAILHKNSDPLGSPYELYATVSGNCASGGVSGFTTTNGTSGPRYSACSPTPLATGVWTHLALTYDQTSLKLYKNGALIVTTSTAAGYIEPSTLSLQIGGSEFGEYFQGLIDEVRLYNVALPITAASNTVAGAACTSVNFADNNAIATASIVGNMNCPIINLNPPSQFKLSASATELKIGASATGLKIGANP